MLTTGRTAPTLHDCTPKSQSELLRNTRNQSAVLVFEIPHRCTTSKPNTIHSYRTLRRNCKTYVNPSRLHPLHSFHPDCISNEILAKKNVFLQLSWTKTIPSMSNTTTTASPFPSPTWEGADSSRPRSSQQSSSFEVFP